MGKKIKQKKTTGLCTTKSQGLARSVITHFWKVSSGGHLTSFSWASCSDSLQFLFCKWKYTWPERLFFFFYCVQFKAPDEPCYPCEGLHMARKELYFKLHDDLRAETTKRWDVTLLQTCPSKPSFLPLRFTGNLEMPWWKEAKTTSEC